VDLHRVLGNAELAADLLVGQPPQHQA
jgi:hypothetical protein